MPLSKNSAKPRAPQIHNIRLDMRDGFARMFFRTRNYPSIEIY
jgi:hypothetical protein